jgi:hypothetical protein
MVNGFNRAGNALGALRRADDLPRSDDDLFGNGVGFEP